MTIDSYHNIANLLFEAGILKNIPRSGYNFLGIGKESVAEHSFLITFIAYVMAMLNKNLDALKLITMCLVHDLPEAKIGDLNYVQKQYVSADESKAIEETTSCLPFGKDLADLINEFNDGITAESRHAHDADQLSFILDLKKISDIGVTPPEKWIPPILKRLKTDLGKKIANSVLNSDSDDWWIKIVLTDQ